MVERLREFWALVVGIWQDGVLGIDIGSIVLAIGIFAVFMVLRRLFTVVVVAALHRWAKRTRVSFDDHIVAALRDPIRFIPVVLGVFFALEALDLSGMLQRGSENIVRSLIAYTIFWAFYRLVDPLSVGLKQLERMFTPELMDWLVKAIKLAFIFIGLATILEVWGIRIGPIIAGLGLLGVAVALGAQDLFKNLIAGLMVLAEKRFKRGDWVFVDGVVEGVVESIGFRSTRIRRFDKAPVYVPNTFLSDNAVTNFTAMSHRRIYWMIGLEYRTTVAQLRQVRDEIEAAVLSDDAFAKPPEVPTFVRVDKFNDSSIDVMLYCFTKTTVWGEWLEIKEALAYRIKDIVEDAGTGFAFPSQSVYIEALPGERPEIFTPPGRSNG